jgi:hypothetical protein
MMHCDASQSCECDRCKPRTLDGTGALQIGETEVLERRKHNPLFQRWKRRKRRRITIDLNLSR